MGLPFLKAVPVAEKITLNLVMWGSVSTVVLIILVLLYLYLFGRLVRRQATHARSASEPYPQLVCAWDLMRVPADLPLMLTVTTATGVFLVLCFWFFLPATTPHPHEGYKQEIAKKTPELKPADVLKKTEKSLAQAESTVTALEAKAEEEVKGKGKPKGAETGKEQGKGKVQDKGKAAEKSSAAQPVAAKAAGQ